MRKIDFDFDFEIGAGGLIHQGQEAGGVRAGGESAECGGTCGGKESAEAGPAGCRRRRGGERGREAEAAEGERERRGRGILSHPCSVGMSRTHSLY